MRRTGIVIAVGLVLTLSCANRGARSAKQVSTTKVDSVNFTMVQPPAILEDNAQRLDFAITHFWDKLSPECYRQQVEGQFANWIWISEQVGRKKACESLIKAYEKSPEVILELAEKYLYDPQSPYRDEDIYGALAAYVGGDLQKIARLCALNAVGTKAADFIIEDARGRHFSLYNVKAKFTLLFFSNPYCNACKEIIDALKSSEQVTNALETGELAVVNMYVDEDLEQWRSYLKAYPKSWKSGFDPTFTLQDSEKYNIRAIPSLYLLDENKVVLLKDAPLEKVMSRLEKEIGK